METDTEKLTQEIEESFDTLVKFFRGIRDAASLASDYVREFVKWYPREAYRGRPQGKTTPLHRDRARLALKHLPNTLEAPRRKPR